MRAFSSVYHNQLPIVSVGTANTKYHEMERSNTDTFDTLYERFELVCMSHSMTTLQGLTPLYHEILTAYNDIDTVTPTWSLTQEIEEGNVEYKYKLSLNSSERSRQLVTQLHWRLNEGKGIAVYEIGALDCGAIVGIPLTAMVKSVKTLEEMCRCVNADIRNVIFCMGTECKGYRAARVTITRNRKSCSDENVHICVIGATSAGKSTLIGVLTRKCLDDGNGLARQHVFWCVLWMPCVSFCRRETFS